MSVGVYVCMYECVYDVYECRCMHNTHTHGDVDI